MGRRVRIRAARGVVTRSVAIATVCLASGLGLTMLFLVGPPPGLAGPEPGPAEPDITPVLEPTPAPAEVDFTAAQNRIPIRLFFLDGSKRGLREETREIFETRGQASRAKQALAQLLAGPQDPALLPVLPTDARLTELFLDGHGEAVVDLTPEVATPAGVGEELLSIAAIALTLSRNFPDIERMRLLVGGREVVTLRGHISLEYPLRTTASLYDGLLARSPRDEGELPAAIDPAAIDPAAPAPAEPAP